MSMATAKTMEAFQPLEKSRAEWKKLLPVERYAILFEASTERAFSSSLDRGEAGGHFHLRGLLPAGLQLRGQIR